MYIPQHFNVSDLHWLDWLAEHDSFGTLISTVDETPFASHLPVLYQRTGEQVTLTGHWARPNEQWRSIEDQRVLFIFHGPHAYITPRWYPEPRKHVPTWDYATAHVYGRIRLVEDAAALEKIVSSLAEKFEQHAQSPWRMADSDGARMLRGIIGFELVAERVELKFKLNQNHPKQNVDGVITGLSAENRDDSRSILELMKGPLLEGKRSG